MTGGHSAEHADRSVSDKVDLDDLFKDARPIGDGAAWEVPEFFDSEREREEFIRWYRAERRRETA